MKHILLTQGQHALVDDWNYDYLNQWKWCASKHGKTFYAIRKAWRPDGRRTTVRMHRVLLNLNDPKIETDHRDNDGLNNQEHNIRVATRVQNCRNRRKRINSRSRFKGVSWHTQVLRWMASIHTDGRHIYLGLFDSEVAAAEAYDAAAKQYFGEFAVLNPIGKDKE